MAETTAARSMRPVSACDTPPASPGPGEPEPSRASVVGFASAVIGAPRVPVARRWTTGTTYDDAARGAGAAPGAAG